MKEKRRLFASHDPYDLVGTSEDFLAAVRENAAFQIKSCEPYRKIALSQGFTPDMIRSEADLSLLPVLPTLLFKRHKIFSMPENILPIKTTSSGTGGSKSHMGFDTFSMLLALEMVLRVTAYHKILSPVPANYIVLGYQPHRSNHTAVMKTAMGATLFAPPLQYAFALKYTPEGYQPDLDGVKNALIRYEKSPFPTRFMGFPSYTLFMLKLLEREGIRLKLPKGSLYMLGGGWKQFYREKVDKRELYRGIEKYLGIPESRIVEFFGAAEHPITYCDCKYHHFHIPVYSRVIIRDVDTLEPLPTGRIGMVNLITPMVKSVPILSVMTDDLGVLHEGCPCGVKSPYLEIIGRVGAKEIKTCAAGAEDILKGAGERQ